MQTQIKQQQLQIKQQQQTHKKTVSIKSLLPIIIIVLIVDLIFGLKLYYQDTTVLFAIINILLFGAACIFWLIRIIYYFKDRKNANNLKPNGEQAKSVIYFITQEMRSFTYYFNPDNISYLVQFYLGSQIIGLLLRWCSSLGFIVVSINGYLIKKILKDRYGMTLGDFRNKAVLKIKQNCYLIPKYIIKEEVKKQ